MEFQDIRARYRQLLDDYHSKRIDWKAFEKGLFELKRIRASSANIIDEQPKKVTESATGNSQTVLHHHLRENPRESPFRPLAKEGRFSRSLSSKDVSVPLTPVPFLNGHLSEDSQTIHATGPLQPQHRNGQWNPDVRLTKHYRLQRLLGNGLCGETWLALETDTGNFVNVKPLPLPIQENADAVCTLFYTVQQTAKLRFPNISPVYKTEQDELLGLFVVAAHLNALPLNAYRKQYLRTFNDFPMSAVIRILWTVAKSLDFAHQKGITHRGLKPNNVLVGDSCGVMISDFYFPQMVQAELLRLGQSSDHFETECYTAPEVWLSQRYSSKSDQFSLAALAVQLISGSPPFPGKNTEEVRESILAKEPILPQNLSPRVKNALYQALDREPESRFHGCLDFVAELAEFDIPAAFARKAGRGGLWAAFGPTLLPEPDCVSQATLDDIFPFKDWKSPNLPDSIPSDKVSYPYLNPPSSVTLKTSYSKKIFWRNLTLSGLITAAVGLGIYWESPVLEELLTTQIQKEVSVPKTSEETLPFVIEQDDSSSSSERSLNDLDNRVAPITSTELMRLIQASSANDIRALRRLGEVYFFGKGVKSDRSKSLDYFKQGSELGDAASLFYLGRYYELGLGGVQKNLPEAIALYKRSAVQGYRPAVEQLKNLENRR